MHSCKHPPHICFQSEWKRKTAKKQTEIKMEDLLHSAQMLISTQIPADQTRVTSWFTSETLPEWHSDDVARTQTHTHARTQRSKRVYARLMSSTASEVDLKSGIEIAQERIKAKTRSNLFSFFSPWFSYPTSRTPLHECIFPVGRSRPYCIYESKHFKVFCYLLMAENWKHKLARFDLWYRGLLLKSLSTWSAAPHVKVV